MISAVNGLAPILAPVQLLQASQTTNENLTTLLEKGIRNEENRSVSEPPTPVMKEILQQLIATVCWYMVTIKRLRP